MEALWALGASELKKRLKRPDAPVGVWWKGRRFLPPFTGTETIEGKPSLFNGRNRSIRPNGGVT